jgi:hypothetical protein
MGPEVESSYCLHGLFANHEIRWTQGFVSTLEHAAGDVRQAFVVQNNQARQVILEMVKLAPILKESAKNLRVGGHDGSGRYDGKLHETFALSPRGWIRA